MKNITFLILVIVNQLFAQIPPNMHPSILMQKMDELQLKQAIRTSPELKILHEVILSQSDSLLEKPCLKYEKIGKRLLDVSRECFRRVFYLSYAYRMTSDGKYAKRAENEMLAVSAFADWNPSHFLDVAEMTMGVAIGYDWIFDYLSEDSRRIISNAILNNGIKPSLETKYNGWLNASYNWNQVCNAGIMFGAIAIRDNEPELAKTIIDRSLKSVLKPMTAYEPDGTYPEGYMYWGYGTSLNVLLISAAEKYMQSEIFPVASMPGFIKSASYMLHMVSPTGTSFNYSDCNKTVSLNPSIFWFAQKTNDSGLLWNERKYINSTNQELKKDRFLPAAILWGAGLNFDKTAHPNSNFWMGQGITPVCLMRSSWTDKNAIFLGFKAGSPSAGHAHMDVGSFVMEANGVRWASDFGMQNYNSLESKGVDLWNQKQNSQRWQVFRYNNLAHNTLSFNDSLQRVAGNSKINAWSDNTENMFATSDISEVYAGQVKKVVRTASLIENSYVKISDEITTLSVPIKLRWTMLTEAKPILLKNSNCIELTKDGKKLLLKVKSTVKVTLKIWSTKSPNTYDMDNDGTYLVGFEAQLPENTNTFLEVVLIPLK